MKSGDLSIGVDFGPDVTKVVVFRSLGDVHHMIGEFDLKTNKWMTKEQLETAIGAKLAEGLEYDLSPEGAKAQILGQFAPEEVDPDAYDPFALCSHPAPTKINPDLTPDWDQAYQEAYPGMFEPNPRFEEQKIDHGDIADAAKYAAAHLRGDGHWFDFDGPEMVDPGPPPVPKDAYKATVHIDGWTDKAAIITYDETKPLNFKMLTKQEPIPEQSKWKEEGRCPQCGELGPFVHGAMTCSTHGVY